MSQLYLSLGPVALGAPRVFRAINDFRVSGYLVALFRSQRVKVTNTPSELEKVRSGCLDIVVGAFSVAARAIAVLGVFGMTSYIVACRTCEIGVRIAIGAGPADVLRMILGQSVSMALLGTALGLFGCIAATWTQLPH